MKLKDISRTATFAWDLSSSSAPLIATGAVAGALDESFSNDSQLEIWAPNFGQGQGMRLGAEGNKAEGSITVSSRFNRLAWSAPSETHARGVLAAGMETGEINVFDPAKILEGASAEEARLFKSDKHTGPVRGLDFNPIQRNSLATGAINAEVFVFDLNDPNSAPKTLQSTKLSEITSLQWNRSPSLSRVLAASSSSGYTTVWDTRASREVASLQYSEGTGTGLGRRRGMSDICWHPLEATQLITASDDDESPIIMLWDLRKTQEPRKILRGHHKGVLSVSWCRQDADLLLSSGKDNRTVFWNPDPLKQETPEIIGELPASNDWCFQTAWCPRNPNLLATASFDGHISIHSIQTTQLPVQPSQKLSDTATADDVFAALGIEDAADEQESVLSLMQPPKWLRRPTSASFGFGGLLASTSNLPGPSGKHQSGVVHLRRVVTEQGILDRVTLLRETFGQKDKMIEFCDSRVTQESDAAWKTLQTLFKANSKEELVLLLGFSKEEVSKQVSEAIRRFPSIAVNDANKEREPTVADAELAKDDASTPRPTEATSSEANATSEAPLRETSGATEQSLFADDTPGTPSAGTADFFSSMAAGNLRNPQLDQVIPHKPEVAASSVAATIGSRASSVRSEAIKDSNTFRIYPSDESEVDRLITQSLVLSDFASAVSLCLASERFADALLLAVRGGPELLQSTQKAYFARRTTSLPFLRVFQSIVTEDLLDIVQNADLSEWKVIFVVLCTFAKETDFGNLAEQLGQRLQFKWQMLAGSASPEAKTSARSAREDATLCYLAARKLEKVVSIWIDELVEEEEKEETTKYTAHAQALQSFIEKVAVFTAATGYVDEDLMTPTESAAAFEAGARTYKLAGLYDRYYEYADLLATQGMIDVAVKYVEMTPPDYKGTGSAGSELDKARDRLFSAADGTTPLLQAKQVMPAQATSSNALPPSGYAAEASPAPFAAVPASTATAYDSSTSYQDQPARTSYQPQHTATDYQPQYASMNYQPQQSYGYSEPSTAASSQKFSQTSPYGPSNGYGPSDQQPQGYGMSSSQPYGAPSQPASLAPPPRAGANGPSSTAPPPPVPAINRRDIPGWNDLPSLAPPKPASAARDAAKPAPIMSPFPMSTDPMAMAGALQQAPTGMTSPPPRASQPGMLPPPPRGGPRPPSAQAVVNQASSPSSSLGRPPPHAAPPRQPMGRGGPPPGVLAGPPPQRALSPLGPQGRVASPLSSQIRPPPFTQPARALSPPQAPPPGLRLAGPPPLGRMPSVQAVPATTPPIATAPPQPQPPAKASYPSGDRSRIPPTSRPIYDTLSGELNRVKQANLPAHLKRIVDDTERRLNILFDGLNNETVPKQAIDQMDGISKAISARDMNAALAMHVELLTNATGDITSWAPGVKQLIRLGL